MQCLYEIVIACIVIIVFEHVWYCCKCAGPTQHERQKLKLGSVSDFAALFLNGSGTYLASLCPGTHEM